MRRSEAPLSRCRVWPQPASRYPSHFRTFFLIEMYMLSRQGDVQLGRGTGRRAGQDARFSPNQQRTAVAE